VYAVDFDYLPQTEFNKLDPPSEQLFVSVDSSVT
jgi:hypothetical protein